MQPVGGALRRGAGGGAACWAGPACWGRGVQQARSQRPAPHAQPACSLGSHACPPGTTTTAPGTGWRCGWPRACSQSRARPRRRSRPARPRRRAPMGSRPAGATLSGQDGWTGGCVGGCGVGRRTRGRRRSGQRAHAQRREANAVASPHKQPPCAPPGAARLLPQRLLPDVIGGAGAKGHAGGQFLGRPQRLAAPVERHRRLGDQAARAALLAAPAARRTG